MARRGQRRTGARDSYHLARDWSRPRPPLAELAHGAVYKRRRYVSIGGYGGRYSPHAERLPARPVARPRGYWPPPLPTMLIYGPGRAVAKSAPISPSRGAFLAWSGHRGLNLMSTTLGDRKTEPVRRPSRVPECARRESRREVMFAQGVAGRRGSAPGKRGTYKRTVMSEFHCRG